MSFLSDMKQRIQDAKEEKKAREEQVRKQKEENPEIDVSPQGEKVRRINKYVIFGVTGILVIGAMWLLSSPSDTTKKAPPKDDAKTVQTDFITDKTVQDANAKAAKGGTDAGKNPQPTGNRNSQNQQGSSYQSGSNTNRSTNSSGGGNNYQGTTNSYRNTSSGSSSASASVSPKPQISQEEQWQNEVDTARHKRAMKEEEAQYSEDQQSKKSQIFFSFDSDQTSKKEPAKSNSSPANDYYNSLGEDTGVTDSEGDYIQVVSDNGPARRR